MPAASLTMLSSRILHHTTAVPIRQSAPAELEKSNVAKEVVICSNFLDRIGEEDLDSFLEELVNILQAKKVRILHSRSCSGHDVHLCLAVLSQPLRYMPGLQHLMF